jgi:hypothetical protein
MKDSASQLRPHNSRGKRVITDGVATGGVAQHEGAALSAEERDAA